jgi:hypothetical protein
VNLAHRPHCRGVPDHPDTPCASRSRDHSRSAGFPSQRGEILLRGEEFSDEETRRKFDKDFREDAARLVRETGKPIAQWPGTWASTRAPWATIDAYARGLVEYLETRERDGTDTR